ncbi:AfsR/SARP family transcriptional regulator [Actinomycetospora sp. CA-084318]|uniref:AfsR/SARP family transcriptional regulator n=1 Tax=Actinomycetospora sp. CA-084318 TaxID=3239892 RepID=UPI003D976589
MSAVQLTVIGRFTCREGERPLLLAPRAERLMAFLSLARRPVRREELAGALWGDQPDERAAGNLRSTLWRLRRLAEHPLVESSDGHVAVAGHVRVDLWDVEAGPTPDVEQRLLAGELLPGWDDVWVGAERERFRQLHLHALEDLCAEHRRSRRFGDALRLGLVAVACDPLRETAHREVIEVHLEEGNVVEALRQYDAYRRLLHSELDLAPSPAMRAVIDDYLDRVVGDDPSFRPSAAPAIRAARGPVG